MPHLVELCQQNLESLLLLRSSSSHDFLRQTGPMEGVPCWEQVVLGQSGRRGSYACWWHAAYLPSAVRAQL